MAIGVMPYEFHEAKNFSIAYLSGFLAERRDIEREAVQDKMQGEMRESAASLDPDVVI